MKDLPLTRWAAAVAALCLTALAHAVAPVEVVALFKDRAVVRTAAGEKLLRVGETSEDGVTLLSADASLARVRFRDEVYDLSLSSRVSANFQVAEKQRIAISPDGLGQYRVRGSINQTFANFLVDTGASVVAMSSRHAQSLGLDYRSGERGSVETAQGTTESWFITLDEVSVGGIRANNVQAAVIDGSYPVDILLGMSYLRQVGMEEREGVLTLVQKY